MRIEYFLMQKPPIIGFAAFSGTGKTTLLEKLLPLLCQSGLKIGLIKASHHNVDPDKPGKDSYRLRHAGARQLVLSTPERSICYTEYRQPQEQKLEDQLKLLDLNTLDLVIVEGFRDAEIPKIELHRKDYPKPFLFEQDPHIAAMAWDGNPGIDVPEHLPLLDINHPENIAEFIHTRIIDAGKTMTDCCSTPGLMPLEQALETLATTIKPVTEQEQVTLENSLDRVIARDIVSPINVPSHNNSAMDGYALRLTDLENTNTLILGGQSLAGHPFEGEFPVGQCIRIMTGASIPEGADTVIMQEWTEVSDKQIQFNKKPAKQGANIRLAGEDISEGDKVFAKGNKIKPQDIGLLASLGIAEVAVFRRVKAAVFSTGDELKLPGETLRHGDIYDSNRFVVKAMLSRLNIEVIDLGKIADDMDQLREAFLKADREADVVITSGGVSVGDADYTKDILEELGETGFWKLAIKPGKPFAFGKLPNSYFFGLPGNPVSATVTFQQLAAPALRHMMNQPVQIPVELSVPTLESLKKRPGRRDFQRGVLVKQENGGLAVTSTGSQGSGILSSMSVADCYMVIPEATGNIEPGETVKAQLFDELLK